MFNASTSLARGWRILPDHVVSVVGWGTDPEEGVRGEWWECYTPNVLWKPLLDYLIFSPRILVEMIHFDFRIFFRWVGEKPNHQL